MIELCTGFQTVREADYEGGSVVLGPGVKASHVSLLQMQIHGPHLSLLRLSGDGIQTLFKEILT